MNELVMINGKQLETKEYQGERVVTAWDIAEVHGREAGNVNRQFERNREKLIEGEDYFIISKEEFSECHEGNQRFIPNNVKEIPLFTESGYLMLNKTFNDKLSWDIQILLIKNYFRQKEFKPMTIEDLIIMQAQEVKKVKEKVDDLEYRVENKITLDSGEQRNVTKEVGKRVYERSEKTGVPVKILYQALYRDLKDIFGVASYKDIKQKDLEDALKYIKNWIEIAEIRENSGDMDGK